MPLDAALAPKTLTSTLHYLIRGTERPAAYRIEPPPGVPRWNGTDDPREVTIEDARGREAEFTLDTDYVFEGPDGAASLLDLFEGRSQLIVQHFMFGPTGTRAARAAAFPSPRCPVPSGGPSARG